MDRTSYENNLERLYDAFGRIALIPILKAAEFVGVDWRTLKRDRAFPTKKIGGRYYVGTEQLARWLS